jgi:hemoglobin
VADFLCESFGEPKNYTAVHEENAMTRVIGKHLEKNLSEIHRKQWMKLILESADELGLPNNPEFRGVLVGHLEWGSRFAVTRRAGGSKILSICMTFRSIDGKNLSSIVKI